MSGRAILGRLPELDRISIGVLHAGEAAVGIRLLVDLDRDARLAQLLDHGVQIAHAEVEHPRLLLAAEVVGIGREGLEHRRAGFLAPGLLVVARRALKPCSRTPARRAGGLRTRCPNPPRAPSGSARSARSPPPSTSPRGPRSRRSLPSSP